MRPGECLPIFVLTNAERLTRMVRCPDTLLSSKHVCSNVAVLMMYSGPEVQYPALRTFIADGLHDDEIRSAGLPVRLILRNSSFADIFQSRKQDKEPPQVFDCNDLTLGVAP